MRLSLKGRVMTEDERLIKLEQLLTALNKWTRDPSYNTYQGVEKIRLQLNSEVTDEFKKNKQ